MFRLHINVTVGMCLAWASIYAILFKFPTLSYIPEEVTFLINLNLYIYDPSGYL